MIVPKEGEKKSRQCRGREEHIDNTLDNRGKNLQLTNRDCRGQRKLNSVLNAARNARKKGQHQIESFTLKNAGKQSRQCGVGGKQSRELTGKQARQGIKSHR